MSSKIDTEVIVGGKVFTISGFESEEYLQKVATYLNGKFNKLMGFVRKAENGICIIRTICRTCHHLPSINGKFKPNGKFPLSIFNG